MPCEDLITKNVNRADVSFILKEEADAATTAAKAKVDATIIQHKSIADSLTYLAEFKYPPGIIFKVAPNTIIVTTENYILATETMVKHKAELTAGKPEGNGLWFIGEKTGAKIFIGNIKVTSQMLSIATVDKKKDPNAESGRLGKGLDIGTAIGNYIVFAVKDINGDYVDPYWHYFYKTMSDIADEMLYSGESPAVDDYVGIKDYAPKDTPSKVENVKIPAYLTNAFKKGYGINLYDPEFLF